MAEPSQYSVILKHDSRRGGAKDSKAIDLPANEAVPLILAGDAELARTQITPPFELLLEAGSRARNLESLGPAVTSKDAFRKIDAQVFRNGLRQTIIEAQTLFWADGCKEALQLVQTCLSGCTNKDANIFEQLRAALARYLSRQGLTNLSHDLNRQQMEENLLVPLLPGTTVVYTINDYYYHRVSKNWYKFYFNFEEVSNLVESVFQGALELGQVIVAQDTPKGDRLISPELVGKLDLDKKDGEYHFLATRDLPAVWFTSDIPLNERKSGGRKWAERVLAHFGAMGLRPAGSDIQAIMQEKHALTQNAVREVWRLVEGPNRGLKGSIKEEQRVSLNEIRRFK